MIVKKTAKVRNQIKAEAAYIMMFLSDVLEPKDGGIVPVKKVYEEYKSWRKELGIKKTQVSSIGFGRLVPKTYKRDVKYHDGCVEASFVDVRLR